MWNYVIAAYCNNIKTNQKYRTISTKIIKEFEKGRSNGIAY